MNKIRIAILGLGVVGSHVVKLLEKNSYIIDNTKCEIVAIGAKNKKKKRIFNVSKYKWVNDFKSLNQIKPDLIIETIGGKCRTEKILTLECNNFLIITLKVRLNQSGWLEEFQQLKRGSIKVMN